MQIQKLSRHERRAKQAYLREQNARWPVVMAKVPKAEWPINPNPPAMVFRSRNFLAQIYDRRDGAIRISVMRTMVDESGNWLEGISWEELMQVKSECGFGDRWAVEIFPPDDQVVNVANMRHLFIVEQAPDFAWRQG